MNLFKRSIILTNNSVRFVFSNIPALKRHLTVIFPLFLIVVAANHYAVAYEANEVVLMLKLPLSYLLSCFFLTWHRVCLRGVDEKSHSPLDFERGAIRFHLMFFGIFLSFDILNRCMIYLNQNPAYVEANIGLATAMLVGFVVAFVFLLRLMFFLPAQSVGVTFSFSDIMKSSKGQIGTFLLSSVFFSIAMMIAVSIYSVIMASINMFVIGDVELTRNVVAGISFVLSVPIYLIMFLYAAVEVTALSKLYQHGMENNA